MVDLFGSQAGGLEFVMDHMQLCGGVLAFGGAATFCRLYLLETSIERISYRLRSEFFGALLKRPISFFDEHKTGELINRLSNDITVTSRVIIDGSMGIRSTITACVGTFMVFHLAPPEMMAGLLAPVAFLFVFGVGYGRLVRRIAERRQDLLAKSVQLAEERLGGVRTVRTFNAEARELLAFQKMLDQVYAVGRQNAMAAGGFAAIFVVGGGSFLLHIVYNCGLMVSSGVVSMGTTVSLAMYCFMAGSSYTGLMTSYGEHVCIYIYIYIYVSLSLSIYMYLSLSLSLYIYIYIYVVYTSINYVPSIGSRGDIQKSLGACQKVLSLIKEDGGRTYNTSSL